MSDLYVPPPDDADNDVDDDVGNDVDRVPAADDPSLTEYDKTLADSFPSSDPPAMP